MQIETFQKPLFIAFIALVGLASYFPFCGLEIETMTKDFIGNAITIALFQLSTILFLALGLQFLSASTAIILRVYLFLYFIRLSSSRETFIVLKYLGKPFVVSGWMCSCVPWLLRFLPRPNECIDSHVHDDSLHRSGTKQHSDPWLAIRVLPRHRNNAAIHRGRVCCSVILALPSRPHGLPGDRLCDLPPR